MAPAHQPFSMTWSRSITGFWFHPHCKPTNHDNGVILWLSLLLFSPVRWLILPDNTTSLCISITLEGLPYCEINQDGQVQTDKSWETEQDNNHLGWSLDVGWTSTILGSSSGCYDVLSRPPSGRKDLLLQQLGKLLESGLLLLALKTAPPQQGHTSFQEKLPSNYWSTSGYKDQTNLGQVRVILVPEFPVGLANAFVGIASQPNISLTQSSFLLLS